jgi:Ca-activated chloride channel family protein
MSWAAPLILWVLLLPVAAAFAIRRDGEAGPSQRWAAIRRVAVSGTRLRAPGAGRLRPGYISLAAIALALMALARPLWGEREDGAFTHAREVMIALDLSRSMLAIDVEPNRLAFAHALTTQLLDTLQGERVGLIVFAGTAFVQVPLSPDYQIIREFLPMLAPDYMPQGGSDYTGMLQAALEGFGDSEGVDRYLLVLSDGESTTEGWQDKLNQLATRSVHVLAVGIGTEAGGFLDDGYGGYYKDQAGDIIHSRLQPATLQALAKRTQGEYLNPGEVQQAVAALVGAVQSGRQGRFEGDVSAGARERFQWFLLPAVLLAFVGLWLEFRPRPTPRAIQRRPKPSPAVAMLAASLGALGALSAPPASAHFDTQADFEVREVFDSNPVERLRKIVRHLATFDYDAYDLRLMVEETIKYGLDEQRLGLVPAEGVIRDAIAATEQGEALDPTVADWSFYRARLAALLVKPAAEDAAESQERPPTPLDEEDAPPMVAGQSTQSTATDSFGQGASAKTDAALGDLTPSEDVQAKRGNTPPPPPRSARMAALRASRGNGGGNSDPILSFSRKRMEEATKRDSPGRLHQLLTDTPEQQAPPQQDW